MEWRCLLGLAEPLDLRWVVLWFFAVAASGAGGGYWRTDADGIIYAHGDASMHGSLSRIRLNRPIVGMAASSTGSGYWLVASDGGIFAFGDAPFYGSIAAPGSRPVRGMTPTSSGHGYWLVTSEYASPFGDASEVRTGGAVVKWPVRPPLTARVKPGVPR